MVKVLVPKLRECTPASESGQAKLVSDYCQILAKFAKSGRAVKFAQALTFIPVITALDVVSLHSLRRTQQEPPQVTRFPGARTSAEAPLHRINWYIITPAKMKRNQHRNYRDSRFPNLEGGFEWATRRIYSK
jgi:hypothetical protein